VGVCLLAWGCSSDRTEGSNQPPSLALTPEPIEGDELSYNARFTWAASDPDGFIARFEYALDPPSAFSETEIAKGGPGIVVEVLPDGTGGVTRVSKTVDGQTVSFDWVHTREFSRRFTFSATEADSVDTPDGRIPSGRFRGMHAFYVRAVDDMGAASDPGRAAFTATTLAPSSRLIRPTGERVVIVGPEVTARWSGDDPDGNFNDSGRFLHVLLDAKWYLPEFTADDAFKDAGPWLPIEEATKSFMLDPGVRYYLGVRAVDAAGAAEPFLEWGRNALLLSVRATLRPALTVRTDVSGSPMHVSIFSMSSNSLLEFSVSPNTPVAFSWSATAEESSA
jgi:hypothetical protein